jgi:ABC-2 type transport system permease protein
MLMVLRLSATAAVPAWQPCLGIATTVVATLVCVWLAGRIFRVGLLMQGKPPRLGEILRWAVRG